MTRTLQRAEQRIAALPAREQDAKARWMLRELADEARWDRNLRRSRAAYRLFGRIRATQACD